MRIRLTRGQDRKDLTVKKDNLVIISMEDWPHDIIFGVFRLLSDLETLKTRFEDYHTYQPRDFRGNWVNKMVEDGLLEKISAAHLCLGESWYPPKWDVLSEAGEE